MSISKIDQLDISALSFSDVKTNSQNRKMVFVNNNNKKVLIQTPKMYLPSGANRWRQKDALDNKGDVFEMELSFGGDSPDVQMFHKKMQDYDTIVKNKILENPKDWLGKNKVSMETIEDAFYSPVVKLAYDKNHNRVDYPDRMKVKLDRERCSDDNDNFTGRFVSSKKYNTPVLAFDTNKKQLDFNESTYDRIVPKGSHIICVLELVYISIAAKVSTKWKVIQFKVFKNEENINSYAIDDEEEEVQLEESEEESEKPALEPVLEPALEGSELVDDQDECTELENLKINDTPEVTVKKVVRPRKKTESPVVA
jgi:hypothetical protein